MTAHLLRQDQHGQRWCIDHCAGPDCWRHPDTSCCGKCMRTTVELEDDLDRLGSDVIAELPLLHIQPEEPCPSAGPRHT